MAKFGESFAPVLRPARVAGSITLKILKAVKTFAQEATLKGGLRAGLRNGARNAAHPITYRGGCKWHTHTQVASSQIQSGTF